MIQRIKRYILLLAVVLIAAQTVFAAKDKEREFVVVLDAGHGGKDIGATDNNVQEKDINLGVTLKLAELIKSGMQGTKVVLTRDGDSYLTLQERADKANNAKGDIFISIHTNSVDKTNKNRTTVSGSAVYALGLHKDQNNMAVARRENSVIELEKNFEQKYSGFDPSSDESYIIFEMAQKKNLSQSIKLADEVQKQLVSVAGRKDRGVHQAGFWVLWATSMPSILVELDFICNPNSAKYISSSQGQEVLAKAIYNAIESYYKSYKRQITSSASQVLDVAVDDNAAVVLASSESKQMRTTTEPTVANKKSNSSGATSAARRRRSSSSRENSLSRNIETTSIPTDSPTYTIAQKQESAVADNASGSDVLSKKISNSKSSKNKTTVRSKAKIEKLTTVYKIQILASTDQLSQSNPRFCGLSPISFYKENNLYKYTYGESASKAEIEALLKDVKKKIPDAFIIKSSKSVVSSDK
jgi:N-acetylmuramoyl-L-alanine amidase